MNDYYPFGLIMPGRSSNSANPNDNYKFTGHERDDEAGLNIYHANARGYDPVLGRFMQVDPLADQFPGWTPYHYVYNNPLRLVDPTGEQACPVEDCRVIPNNESLVAANVRVAKEGFRSAINLLKQKQLRLAPH